jgi:hypothetical protein
LSKFIPLRPAKQGARWGRIEEPNRGPGGGPDGGVNGARRKARRGGGRKDYLFLKEKMTCFVYVSYKSSSASNVSDAKWM